MLGLIIWAILIIFIAFCACPGFGAMILTLLGIAILGIFILWLLARLTDNPEAEEVRRIKDREKAIDEWEKKWGRRHPSRINKKK